MIELSPATVRRRYNDLSSKRLVHVDRQATAFNSFAN